MAQFLNPLEGVLLSCREAFLGPALITERRGHQRGLVPPEMAASSHRKTGMLSRSPKVDLLLLRGLVRSRIGAARRACTAASSFHRLLLLRDRGQLRHPRKHAAFPCRRHSPIRLRRRY